jgi:hypothetical protein
VNDTSCVSSFGKSVATQAIVPYPRDLSYFYSVLFWTTVRNSYGSYIAIVSRVFINIYFISVENQKNPATQAILLTSVFVIGIIRRYLNYLDRHVSISELILLGRVL